MLIPLVTDFMTEFVTVLVTVFVSTSIMSIVPRLTRDIIARQCTLDPDRVKRYQDAKLHDSRMF